MRGGTNKMHGNLWKTTKEIQLKASRELIRGKTYTILEYLYKKVTSDRPPARKWKTWKNPFLYKFGFF